MNKQRKVLVTITYNELGIIIDTKTEEVTQPNLQPTCNNLATDCISRQAAMNALNQDPMNGMNFVWILNNLPSIQPEQRWIPCSERLPTKYGFYLVTLNNYCTDFCIWNGKEFGMGTNKKWSRCDEVTAWLPLPEPYKGKL